MRYAIYYAPGPGGLLAERAARWLGRDAATGAAQEQPAIPGIAPDAFYEMTASPRRYGFHGTLKAPFRLADGVSEAELIAAVEDFARGQDAVEVPQIVPALLGGFVALVPGERSPALDRFAGAVVEAFEPLRAPLTDAEIARRNPEALTARQSAYLDRFGYPYVFDEFRYHMTLSNRLDAAMGGQVRAFAETWFAETLSQPFVLDALTIFVEREAKGPFEILARAPLAAEKQRKTA